MDWRTTFINPQTPTAVHSGWLVEFKKSGRAFFLQYLQAAPPCAVSEQHAALLAGGVAGSPIDKQFLFAVISSDWNVSRGDDRMENHS